MLTPGTTTWTDAIPVVIVAALLLFVPGTVTGLILRLRPLAALSLAPVLSTTCLSVSGIVAPMVGLSWGVGPLVGAALVMWGITWLLRCLLPDPRSTAAPDEPTSRQRGRSWMVTRLDTGAWATLLGVVVAQGAVAVALVQASGSPEQFPQAPDTIFHLATPSGCLRTATSPPSLPTA